MIIGAGLDARLGLSFDELREAGAEADQAGLREPVDPGGGGFPTHSTYAPPGRPRASRSGRPPFARESRSFRRRERWRPESLAIQAATVGLLSEARFVLGVGSGGAGNAYFSSLGLPNRPVAVMRDFLVVLRALLAGEEVTYSGPGAPALAGSDRLEPAPGARVPRRLGSPDVASGRRRRGRRVAQLGHARANRLEPPSSSRRLQRRPDAILRRPSCPCTSACASTTTSRSRAGR